MGGSGGLQLGEDSVGVGRKRGSAAWGLGWLGPVTLRLAEACVGGLGLGSAWATEVEAEGGVGRRARSD